jgi:acyl dehydratase
MRHFEDLVEGRTERSGTLTVEREPMLEFARRYDPQYFHADAEAAKGSPFGEVVASGIYTMALWRQLDHQIAHDIAWICGVAWDDVRFAVAVRAGDTLQAEATCLERRDSGSDPRRGVVVYAYVLRNQRGEVVFSCRSTNLVWKRGFGAPSGASPTRA